MKFHKYLNTLILVLATAIMGSGQTIDLSDRIRRLDIKGSFILINFESFYRKYGTFPESFNSYLDTIRIDESAYDGFRLLCLDPYSDDKFFHYVKLTYHSNVIGFCIISNWLDRKQDFKPDLVNLKDLISQLDKSILVPSNFVVRDDLELFWSVDREMVFKEKSCKSDILVAIYYKK